MVGYSGNLGRAHEYATLLDAAEQFRDDQNIVFLFIGGGHLTGKLQNEIERRGLASTFQFRPYQDAESLATIPLGARRSLDLVAAGDGGADRAEQILRDSRGGSPDDRRLRSGR